MTMNYKRLSAAGMMLALAMGLQAQVTPVSQMERLNRGLVAVPTNTAGTNNFVSWRLLGTDDKTQVTFDLLRDGEVIANDLTKTNFQDNNASATAQYQVVTKVSGQSVETSEAITPWRQKFLTLQLQQPAKGKQGGTYIPNDISVGDMDGDGQYELIVKWDPDNSKDNSQSGKTDNVFIDCYKLPDAQLLWRVDLGTNIRAGAHYTQFMVYDFDGDGRAELICKTATGSKDGEGNYVNQAATDATILAHPNNKDYRNSDGHVLQGPEYLTVFNGLTGAAVHTTWYLPGRAGTGSKLPSGSNATEGGSELGKVSSYPDKSFWGDNYGNRSERFLAAVAYINGADQRPCAIFCRGYYTKAYVWAVSFDGNRLHTEWLHASPTNSQTLVFKSQIDESQSWPVIEVDGDRLQRNPAKSAPAATGKASGSKTLFGNGNHNMSVADVDGDGCDEIVWGSSALNNDGTLLYATGFGHGDAIHLGKMRPDDEGYQVFQVHEEEPYGWDLHDARTGEVFYSATGSTDNGRGMAAALVASLRNYQFWSSNSRYPRSATTGNELIKKSCSVNFRIYWDGTIADQLFDGGYDKDSGKAAPYIQKWNGSSFVNVLSLGSSTYNNPQTCNTTKATPCLQADILGDWREELVMWNYDDPSQVMLFTTWTPTNYAVPTLMHDHVYRMGIAWQNTAYNQPPHIGYCLKDYIDGKLSSAVPSVVAVPQQTATQYFDLSGRRLTGLHKGLNIVRRNGRVEKIVKD